jgi:hypothetical protein
MSGEGVLKVIVVYTTMAALFFTTGLLFPPALDGLSICAAVLIILEIGVCGMYVNYYDKKHLWQGVTLRRGKR